MSLFEQNVRNYWNYYLELESELCQTKKYVEFNSENERTFSVEFLKLFQAICSEIDVVGKYVASIVNKDFKIDRNTTIRNWWFEIQNQSGFCSNINRFQKGKSDGTLLHNATVTNNCIGKSFSPWCNFKLEKNDNPKSNRKTRLANGCSTPQWWIDYNSVKHERTTENDSGSINFTKANLGNVCNSIAALYILELFVLELSADSNEQTERFFNESKLFVKN